jgi:hypothetical protein
VKGTISVMPAPESKDPDFLSSQTTQEKTSWMPWIVAAVVLVVVVAVLAIAGGHSTPIAPVGNGMAPADPYAAKLSLTGLAMSEATSFSGGKVTYIDGQIANTGDRTLTAITVQVGFHSDTGEFAQRIAEPLSQIRTRQPYVDTQPVSAAPLEPGQTRDFRLIFDAVPSDWNLQMPEVRVIGVKAK